MPGVEIEVEFATVGWDKRLIGRDSPPPARCTHGGVAFAMLAGRTLRKKQRQPIKRKNEDAQPTTISPSTCRGLSAAP